MKKNVSKTLYRVSAIAAVGVMSLAMLTGCGKKKEETSQAPAPVEEPVCNVTPVTNLNSASDVNVIYKEGMVLSDLSGEWIDESLANQKPLCIMINNIVDAMPQSGISQADITYEFMVEGGITRFMCVFKDYETGIEKLGPVRSSRHYYAMVARELEGLYAHFGWSAVAEEYIKGTPGYENLNGLELEGSMYYRDSSRVAPHNVYTDSEKIMDGISRKGYSMTHNDSYSYSAFKFNQKDTALGTGNVANKVTTAFNGSTRPWFEYDAENKVYKRFQYGGEQIDANTGEQLTYKNVIVMMAYYEQIGDSILKNVVFEAGGSGYYISDGEYIAITWEDTRDGIIYRTSDGNQLRMNPGNTFISVCNSRDDESGAFFE